MRCKLNRITQALAAALLMPMFSAGAGAQAATRQQAAAPARAAMETVRIPSHGNLLNGFVYVAAGNAPHPAVILLHGFPGNERNLDLAQDIRRAGWDVLFFDYRGSWGSPGDFSFSHGIEDTAAAVAFLRDPAHAKLLRLDPANIVLLGHSMGGFMAVQAGAADHAIRAIGLISAADLAGTLPLSLPPQAESAIVQSIAPRLAAEGMAPLAGCTPEGLAREIFVNSATWRFPSNAKSLAKRPILVVTSDDGLAPVNDAFVAALRSKAATEITTLHLATDHSYSDQRLELSAAIVHWLRGMTLAPRASASLAIP